MVQAYRKGTYQYEESMKKCNDDDTAVYIHSHSGVVGPFFSI